jgi:hypothetical protein
MAAAARPSGRLSAAVAAWLTLVVIALRRAALINNKVFHAILGFGDSIVFLLDAG